MSADSLIKTKAKAKVTGSAPGQYLGYALQEVRLFYHLLQCPSGAWVGLEHFDDVSVHSSNGEVLLVEQCKSALSGNPVSDAAVDLWKTFSNWADNIKAGFIDPATSEFHLFVVPQKSGALVQRLNDARSDSEISALFEELKAAVHKNKDKPRQCDQYILSFLSLEDQARTLVVQNFSYVTCESDPTKPLSEFLDATVRQNLITEAIKWGIGSAKAQINSLIRGGEDPILCAATFRKGFINFLAKHDQARFLRSFVEEPSADVVDALISKSPVFIKQLELVDSSVDDKTRAASDYLWTSSDKTKWAEDGLIYEESIKSYDDNLKRRHSNLSSELNITQRSLTAEERGLLLFVRCCGDQFEKLDDLVVPTHFLPGSLHNLADHKEIGWHSDFIQLLEDVENNGG